MFACVCVRVSVCEGVCGSVRVLCLRGSECEWVVVCGVCGCVRE